MTVPVSNSQTSITQNTPVTPATTIAAPGGVGSHPSSLSSAAEPETRTSFYSVYLQPIRDFIHELVVKALNEIYSSLGNLLVWVGGSTTLATTENEPISSPLPLPQPESEETDHFSLVPITEEEKSKIYTVIHTVGDSNYLQLAFHSEMLERTGKEIADVHPLRFLETIIQNPTLLQDLDGMKDGLLGIKWRRFISGLAAGFRHHIATIPTCRIGFARALNVDLTDLDPYFSKRDWNGLARTLLDIKTGRRTSSWKEPVRSPAPAPTPPPIIHAPTAPNPTPIARVNLLTLPISTGDQTAIQHLLAHYSTWSIGWLLWSWNESKTWETLHAPALQLLVYLKSTPNLNNSVRSILQSWNRNLFLSAFAAKLETLPIDNLDTQIADFSAACRIEQLEVQHLIQQKQWIQLIDKLYS